MQRFSHEKHIPFPHKQLGITLIEIMIALAIGLIILSAVFYLFINANKSYKVNDGLSQIQENARTAIDMISSDLKQAGYSGCLNMRELFGVGDQNLGILGMKKQLDNIKGEDIQTAIQEGRIFGKENCQGLCFVGGGIPLFPKKEDDTNTFVLSKTGSIDSNNEDVELSENTQFLVSDCAHGVVFKGNIKNKQIHISFIPENSNLNFGREVEIIPNFAQWYSFYIEKNNANGQYYGTLMRKIGEEKAEALIDGVDAIAIQYFSKDGKPVSSSSANNIVGVNIALLVSAPKDKQEQAVDLAFPPWSKDLLIKRDANRFYKVFTTTVALRNVPL